METAIGQETTRRVQRGSGIGRAVGWCVAGAGVVVLVAALFVHHYFRMPKPTGPFAVGTVIIDYTDPSRHETFDPDPAARRHVVVQLWYPAEPSNAPVAAYRRLRESLWTHLPEVLLETDARWNAPPMDSRKARPLLLFSHRWGGERIQNTALIEDLASYGYIVASIDHPYNARRVQLDDGRVIEGHQDLTGPKGNDATAAEQIAFWNENLALWTADERFVLDRLLDPHHGAAIPGPIDLNRIGAFGHSFGGATALAMLGTDPRVRAGLNLDGWTFGGLDHRTAAQPILILYEEATEQARSAQPSPASDPDAQMDAADRAAVEGSLTRFGGWRIYVHGAQHLDFTDQPLLPLPRRGRYLGPIAPAEIDRLDRTVVLAFFDEALLGRPSPLLSGAPAFHQAFPETAPTLFTAPAGK